MWVVLKIQLDYYEPIVYDVVSLGKFKTEKLAQEAIQQIKNRITDNIKRRQEVVESYIRDKGVENFVHFNPFNHTSRQDIKALASYIISNGYVREFKELDLPFVDVNNYEYVVCQIS